MPVVPQNTVSGARKSRIPGVPHVRFRGAEQLGDVGRAIGRGAAIAGQAAGDIRRHFANQAELARARGDAGRAKGSALMQIGANIQRATVTIDQALDRRDRQAAEDALTEAKRHVNNLTQGTVDGATGERTPGTFEAPYAPPGREDQEASGAAVATSKALSEWMEGQDNPRARLSRRQQEMFDRGFINLIENVERNAIKIDIKNHENYLKAADAAATAEDLRTLDGMLDTPDPTYWMSAAVGLAKDYAARKHRAGLVDPTEMDPANFKWRTPEDEALAHQLEQEFMAKALTNRALYFVEKSVNAATDGEARNYLEHAQATAELDPQGTGTPIMGVAAAESVRSKITQAEERRASKQHSEERRLFLDAKEAALDYSLGRYEDEDEGRRAFESAASLLPPTRRAELEESVNKNISARKLAEFKDEVDTAYMTYYGRSGTEEAQHAIALLNNKIKTLPEGVRSEAFSHLNRSSGSLAHQRSAELAELQASSALRLEGAIATGGTMYTDDDKPYTATPQQLADKIVEWSASGRLKPKDAVNLWKSLANMTSKTSLYNEFREGMEEVFGLVRTSDALRFDTGLGVVMGKEPPASRISRSGDVMRPEGITQFTAKARRAKQSKERAITLTRQMIIDLANAWITYNHSSILADQGATPEGTRLVGPDGMRMSAAAYIRNMIKNLPSAEEAAIAEIEARIMQDAVTADAAQRSARERTAIFYRTP